MNTVDQTQGDATQRFIHEQIARIDREQARYCRMREEAQPRIDAMLARVGRKWDEQDRRACLVESHRSRCRTCR
ncbi:MAG: hypothetical protein PHI71_01280 [Acidiphilium sp.]|jgi:hypothetical protein|nr:hypothetical protein [Acidiphilium sp.]